jgi:glycosyltransferase involved in cell wall biosynthesis
MAKRICLVSFPWKSYAPYKFLASILLILEPISEKIILIDGNTDRINIKSTKLTVKEIPISMHYPKDTKPATLFIISSITKCIFVQIMTSLELIKVRNDIDIVLFYMAYPHYLLPLIVSKFLRKKTIEVVTRSKTHNKLSRILSFQDHILFSLLDGISLESNILEGDLNLTKYARKLLPEGYRFIDTSNFRIMNKLNRRGYVIGFIGRISEEKGVLEFTRAIPIVAKYFRDVGNIEFLIAGNGELLNKIREECEVIREGQNINIIVQGFIDEKELPEWFNKLRLLVLPSKHAEGIPTTILEAMACGTPVLATCVGAIESVIKDKENGFLMDDTLPESIANNIINILNFSDLERVTKISRAKIERDYTYENAVRRYAEILELEYVLSKSNLV